MRFNISFCNMAVSATVVTINIAAADDNSQRTSDVVTWHTVSYQRATREYTQHWIQMNELKEYHGSGEKKLFFSQNKTNNI